MTGHLRRLLFASCYVYIFMFALYWGGSDKNVLLSLLSAIPWFLLILPVLVLQITLLFLRQRLIAPFFLVLILYGAPFLIHPNAVRSVDFTDKPEEKIRICSLNTEYYFRNRTDRKPVFEWLKQMNCDIYLFQEIWAAQKAKSYIDPEVKTAFPDYNSYYGGEYLTLSRLEVTSVSQPTYDEYLRTVIKKNNKEFALYSVHLWNPLNTRYSNTFQHTRLSDTEVLMLPSELRDKQTSSLLLAASSEKLPVVISGDFNSMQNSYVVRELSNKFTNINANSFGLQATYQSKMPFIKIDHVFLDKTLAVEQAKMSRICEFDYSDHCMLVYEFVLQ
jgi:endonuclease/exonuclease/phosphatase family metal-dependent hydrolase